MKTLFEEVERVHFLMDSFEKTWFIAGGWAIDLFLERETRDHSDLEIAIFRNDQLHMKKYLENYEFKKIVRGESQNWDDEFLNLPIHELHAYNLTNAHNLEILLNELDENKWIFRRDSRITAPMHSVWSYSNKGIPYLNPEIVLLYKAKNAREKDHQDFFAIKDYLNSERKEWLLAALRLHEPEHKWIPFL